MRQKKSIQTENRSLQIVPEEFLEEIRNTQEQILDLLRNQDSGSQSIGDYITEKDAKNILGRKTTWFWNLRKTGQLSYNKVGNKIFYKRADIILLLDQNRNEGGINS